MNIKVLASKILSHRITHKIKIYALAHKVISGVVIFVMILMGYWGIKSLTSTASQPHYVLGVAQKGTIVSSITGSGQVSAYTQIDLKPKVSGDVVYVGVTNGQTVGAGTLLVQLDARDAQKAVRDAEANLESAKISLQKLKQPADTLSTIQTENALTQANDSLAKAYDDAFNTVANAFTDLPTVMTGINDILYGTTVGQGGQDNLAAYADIVKNYDDTVLLFKNDVATKYQTARTSYDQNLIDYKNATRFSDTKTIENLVNETYETTKNVAEAVKSANSFLNFVKDTLTSRRQTIPVLLATHQTSLGTYTSQTSADLLNLFNIKSSITNSKLSIAEKTESLAKLKRGADPLDITSQELAVKQRSNALLDAEEKLADYYIRSPFAGTVAKLNVKKSDSVSSATAVATLITKQKLAEISLNEVDVSKIKNGQKATLTFDAIDGLSLTGKVAEIDSIGTVNQGVVTYNVKVGFDADDDRVKPGMSVSAAIITSVKQDVLAVPSSAVKSQNDAHYVEILNKTMPLDQSTSQGVTSATAPTRQMVEVGISDDALIEIISGLKEGDQIITRTIAATTVATAPSAPSLFGGGGNRGSSVRISR